MPQAEYLKYFPDFSGLRGHLLQLSHYKRHGFREVVSGLRCMLPVGRTDWSLNVISTKAQVWTGMMTQRVKVSAAKLAGLNSVHETAW